MDGAVDTAAPQKGFIGGVDDGIHFEAGDIAFDDGHSFQDIGMGHGISLNPGTLTTFAPGFTCANR